ncbi:MAG TPA: ABC-type transport auxiliary lipoprotein family protein [Syntrophales bacterium]|nr:ABC-type transport auxiliary lipoprotein family protein [Syntrophales bacterium]
MKQILFLLSAMLFVTGCSGKSTYVVQQYLLDYSPPALAGLARVNEVLRVESFSTAQAFASTAMLYQASPLELRSYSRERWRVMPCDMVTDFLLRDLRNAGMFTAVLAYEDPGGGRYVVTGTVIEFLEVDGSDGPRARLSVDATLLDTTEREITKRFVFQKTYTAAEPMKDKSALALAESMSRAMKKFSGELMADIHRGMGSAKGAKVP